METRLEPETLNDTGDTGSLIGNTIQPEYNMSSAIIADSEILQSEMQSMPLPQSSNPSIEALTTIYADSWKMLVNFARRYTETIEQAEDLVSEAFFRSYKSKNVQRGEAKPTRTGMCSIIGRVAIDTWRRSHFSLTSLDMIVDTDDFDAIVPNAHNESESKDTADSVLVQNLLALLPARQRDVVRLRRIEGLSIKETAKAMGITVANVKILDHRGIERLGRVGLKAEEDTPRPSPNPDESAISQPHLDEAQLRDKQAKALRELIIKYRTTPDVAQSTNREIASAFAAQCGMALDGEALYLLERRIIRMTTQLAKQRLIPPRNKRSHR